MRFIFYLMQKQTRIEVVNKVINQKKGRLNLHELQIRFCSKLTSKIIRKYEFTNNKFLKKYRSLQRKYEKGVCKQLSSSWHDNQRKLFIWFSIIFCNHLQLNYDKLTSTHWHTLSFLFFDKNILLLQFETKQIQRNPQRVSWEEKEQQILLDAFKNGKQRQWNSVSKRIFFQTDGQYYKNSKQCRQHWFNHLDKSIKKGGWSKQEDLQLLQAIQRQGRKWSTISRALQERRTQHSIKNRYHSLMKTNNKEKSAQLSEQQRISVLIAELQAVVQQGGAQREQNQNQNQSSQHQESINQQSQNQSSSQDQESEQVAPNNQPASQGWGNLPSIQSPYIFVFSPFSFSSTASPYGNTTWSSWQNSAHQTLFFNPGGIQHMPSYSTFQAFNGQQQRFD